MSSATERGVVAGPIDATDPEPAPRSEPAPLSGAALAVARVRARAVLRLCWLDEVRRATASMIENAPEPLRLAIAGEPSLDQELRARRERSDLAVRAREVDALDELARRDRSSPFAVALDGLGITGAERELVGLCLALAVAPELAPMLAWIAGDPSRGVVTEALAARLFDRPGPRMLRADACSLRWRVLRRVPRAPGEPEAIELDLVLVPVLAGAGGLDPRLAGRSALVERRPTRASWPIDAPVARVRSLWRSGRAARVRIVGPPGSGRRTLAAAIAERVGLRVLAVDAARGERDPDLHLVAQRQAMMAGLALAIVGPPMVAPAGDPAAPITFLISDGTEESTSAEHDIELVVPALRIDERAALIRQLIAGARDWSDADVRAIAASHRLVPGELVEAAAHAPATPEELASVARERARARMGALGTQVRTDVSLDEVILARPAHDALRELVEEARARAELVEAARSSLLFPRGAGLVALFSGPPGTGKTVAAQAVAGSLGLDLVRVDFAAVASKYIGETAKNLRAVFMRAAHMDAVLFFDEADAYFARRTEQRDAHDRHANADTAYLLTLLEEYRGVAILATNQRANLDPAVVRRIRHVIELARPDRAERARLLEAMLARAGARVPAALVEAIAASVELSGAQIRDAVITALVAARAASTELAPAHLVRGIERELVKDGRGLRPEQRERIFERANG